MVRLVLAALVALVVFFGWWFADEPLNDTARNWLDTPVPEANDAYYFLLGIGAPERQSPLETGKFLVDQYDELYTAPSWLPDLSRHALLCSYDQADCLLAQQARTTEAAALIAESGVLLERYRRFLSFEVFIADLPASVYAPVPRYELLATAARLQSLAWALSDTPGTGLQQEIHLLRRLLAGHHTLAGKRLVASLLAEKVRLAALLAQQGKMDYLEEAALRARERDLSSAMRGEFQLLMQGVNAVGNPDSNTGPAWHTRLWFRPNTTTNQITEYLQYIEALSQQPAPEQIAQPRYNHKPSLSRHFRNPAGNRLVAIMPDLNHLTESLLRLDQQLALLSWMAGTATLETHPNPWAPALAPERGKDGLCFTRPDHPPMVCLPLLP